MKNLERKKLNTRINKAPSMKGGRSKSFDRKEKGKALKIIGRNAFRTKKGVTSL